MFFNKVESDKGELEIVYDVQWKTPGNDDDKAKIIGIVDTPDTNLDWNTFKSYLIQNSGNMRFTTDDIRISYLDSDDDLIPIDSEIEFRECLKFSRIRARRGRKIVMKVHMMSNGGAKPKDSSKYGEETSTKHTRPKLFCLKKRDIPDKLLLRKQAVSFDKSCSTSPESTGEGKEAMPEWFEKYMTKFKAELVQEITSSVVSNVRASMGGPGTNHGSVGWAVSAHQRSRNAEMPASTGPAPAGAKGHHHHHHHLHHVLEKRKKKKKMPEEDSSDCTDGLQLQWEERLELLRHMQKINKREKKFEKKLDAKLEKLECKTKKIMEKKHTLWGSKKNAGVTAQAVPPPSAPAPPQASAPAGVSAPSTQCELVMDATPVDEYNYVPHVLRGEVVHQVWKVMNNGQMAWTDETELRFAWGSKSLVPLTTVVKCPLLKPGETGRVKVTLQAPMFPGNFECYWHFHHQGRRFGHWLGCAVIVDAESRSDTPPRVQQRSPCLYSSEPGPLPVDLTMKCHQQTYSTASTVKPDQKTIEGQVQHQPTPAEVEDQPKLKNQDDSIHSLLATSKDFGLSTEDSAGCITETDLEEFPRLESYASLSKPQMNAFMADSYPDLVQRNDEPKSDLHVLVNFLPHDVLVADLLNIKEERATENSSVDDGNVCDGVEAKDETVLKYEKILSDVENMRVQDQDEKKNADAGEYISGSDSDNISIISGTVSVDTDDTEPSDEFVVVPMPTCLNCDQTIEPQGTEFVPVTHPISVEIPKTPSDSDISAHAVQASDNNNNMELKPYPEMPPFYLPVLVAGEGSSQTSITESMQASSCSKPEEELKPEQKSDDENTVYVCDASGKSIPVAKVLKSLADSTDKSNEQARASFSSAAGVSHSTFGDPNFGHGPNGPRFPFGFNNESGSPPPHCHNPGGPCNFRPQHESPPCGVSYPVGTQGVQPNRSTSSDTFCSHFCQNEQQQKQQQQQQQQSQHLQGSTVYRDFVPNHNYQQSPPQQQQQHQTQQPITTGQCPFRTPATYYAFDEVYQQQEAVNAAAGGATSTTWSHGYPNIHTEQPRACKFTYVYNKENTTSPGSANKSAGGNGGSSKGSSRRSNSDSRETSPVAAAVQILPETLMTGAVNVASSAINTARSVIDMLRPRHDEPVVAQWEQVPQPVENSLRTLSEMGFNNRELNVMLLTQYNNDVARVISELVQ